MLISTKGRYALRVMIDLAQQDASKYTPLKDIADRQDISEKYLEAILRILVKENMLVGLRGKGGGYKLNRTPEEYTVWDIISVTEDGAMAPVACLEKDAKNCPRENICKTLPMWQEFDKTIKEFFEKYNLADFANSNADKKYII